jgi:hypothetical protein
MYIVSKYSICTAQWTQCAFTSKTNRLMLYTELMAAYCEKYTKNTNTQCGQYVELLMLHMALHIFDTRLWRFKT